MKAGAVIVLVEHATGEPAPASLAALAVARGLAAALGAPLEAVALGEGAAAAASALGAHGVGVMHVAHDDKGDAGRPFDTPALPGRLLAQLLVTNAPRAMIAAATARGTETLAYAAALTSLPLAAACTQVSAADGEDPARALSVTRLRWGGSVLEEARLDGATVLVTVADGVVAGGVGVDGVAPRTVADGAVAAPPAGAPRIIMLADAAGDPDTRVHLVERVASAAGDISLAEARVVVGGGRGVGGPDAFGPLEELATLLGGTVGVSRVVTGAGWRPHSEQVGQTGTRISPDLYIACGISGAIQHIVGCRGARAILAINTDRDAPIMARATYAVVGDLHAVVPAIIAELHRRGATPGA